jgi:hypothetical protein
MTQTLINMKTLYQRLAQLGLPERYVRERGLPDWWDPELEAEPGGVLKAAAYVSRRLNIDLGSLLSVESAPTFRMACQPKFKARIDTEPEHLSVSQSLAQRVAELMSYACVPEYQGSIPSIAAIRDPILSRQSYVDLNSVLDFCWSWGIPVVHFSDFPKNQSSRKFDGMVAWCDGRPVIVIAKNQRPTAWLLFILAHELGHIAKGHLDGGSLVDMEIDPESQDSEELEANEFAVELLLGKPDMSYFSLKNLNATDLTVFASLASKRDRVDPGVVTLNYTWLKSLEATSREEKNQYWRTAACVLKNLDRDANAPHLMNSYLTSSDRLDWDRLDGDSQDYLELVVRKGFDSVRVD